MRRSFYSTHDGGVLLYVRATPGAAQDAIGGIWCGPDGDIRLTVKISASPDKGKANAAIVKGLSAALGAPKSAISIVAGKSSRKKTVEIAGDPSLLEQKLSQLVEK
jgi:hypothetical protein